MTDTTAMQLPVPVPDFTLSTHTNRHSHGDNQLASTSSANVKTTAELANEWYLRYATPQVFNNFNDTATNTGAATLPVHPKAAPSSEPNMIQSAAIQPFSYSSSSTSSSSAPTFDSSAFTQDYTSLPTIDTFSTDWYPAILDASAQQFRYSPHPRHPYTPSPQPQYPTQAQSLASHSALPAFYQQPEPKPFSPSQSFQKQEGKNVGFERSSPSLLDLQQFLDNQGLHSQGAFSDLELFPPVSSFDASSHSPMTQTLSLANLYSSPDVLAQEDHFTSGYTSTSTLDSNRYHSGSSSDVWMTNTPASSQYSMMGSHSLYPSVAGATQAQAQALAAQQQPVSWEDLVSTFASFASPAAPLGQTAEVCVAKANEVKRDLQVSPFSFPPQAAKAAEGAAAPAAAVNGPTAPALVRPFQLKDPSSSTITGKRRRARDETHYSTSSAMTSSSSVGAPPGSADSTSSSSRSKRMSLTHPEPDMCAPPAPDAPYLAFMKGLRLSMPQDTSYALLADEAGRRWRGLSPTDREGLEVRYKLALEGYVEAMSAYVQSPQCIQYLQYLKDFAKIHDHPYLNPYGEFMKNVQSPAAMTTESAGSPGSEAGSPDGEAIGSHFVDSGMNPRRKKPRPDPHAPAKPFSGYVKFGRQLRRELQTNEEHTFSDISKLVGNAWRDLDPQTKARLQEDAENEKHEYLASMKKYKRTSNHRDYQRYLKDFELAKSG